MSITDELREYVQSWRETPNLMDELDAGDIDGLLGDFEDIADRIDEEHERQLEVLYRDMSDAEYVKLPKDADGVPWHIGDRTESGQTVQAMGLNKHGWHFVGTVNDIDPSIHRHYHAPTVEDVLTEFGIDWEHESDCEDRAALLKEYAAKLRLAKEDA